MTKKILLLPGDGIGPEIVNEAVKVIERLRSEFGLDVELETGLCALIRGRLKYFGLMT